MFEIEVTIRLTHYHLIPSKKLKTWSRISEMTLSDDLNTRNKIFEIWHLWPKSNLYDDLEIKFLKFETCYQNHAYLLISLERKFWKFDTCNRNHVYLMISKSNCWNLTSVTGITVIWWPWNQIFENLKLMTRIPPYDFHIIF